MTRKAKQGNATVHATVVKDHKLFVKAKRQRYYTSESVKGFKSMHEIEMKEGIPDLLLDLVT